MKKPKDEKHWIRNSIIGIISLFIVINILMIAPDYARTDITDRINLVINNSNVTSSLKHSIYMDEKGVIYLSMDDIENFFDSDICYDEQYNQIITTSDTKVATIVKGQKKITINGVTDTIIGTVSQEDDTYFLPFSEMSDVYNIEVNYIEQTDRVIVTSLDRELQKADAAKDLDVKWKKKALSRTLDKIKKGEKVTLVSIDEDGWAKIRTNNGMVGYVKENDLANRIIAREDMNNSTKLNGRVSLVWDYYSEYATAPVRTGTSLTGVNVVSPSFFSLEKLGKGEVYDNAGAAGEEYVQWANYKGYKVWALFSNDGMIETTHEILNDYKLRKATIDNILKLAVKYKVNGINLDFENIYESDKDLYTRFVIELYPRLKEYGLNLSVDVTAPDGSANWSLCFDRYNIARNCDYLIFMAYDQYGSSDTEAGPTAAYDWVKVSLDKFLRDIPEEKIILAIPFYTRTWEIGETVDEPTTVSMKAVYSIIPEDAQIEWKEDERQNYTEYTKYGSQYKMWIEDEKSITEKLNLVLEENLAGVAFWRKGFETDEIWNVINERILE